MLGHSACLGGTSGDQQTVEAAAPVFAQISAAARVLCPLVYTDLRAVQPLTDAEA